MVLGPNSISSPHKVESKDKIQNVMWLHEPSATKRLETSKTAELYPNPVGSPHTKTSAGLKEKVEQHFF